MTDQVREISLETHSVLKNIEKIKEFMFADLDKTIELVHSDKGAPNFMLALVLCAYTHFWGRLINFSGNDKEQFNTFFRELGKKYEDLLDRHPRVVYGKVRGALIHEYLIKANSKIMIEGGDCGIDYDDRKNSYTFYVRRYLEDFKFAVNNYISELMTDVAKFNEAKKALEEGTQLL